MNLKYKKLNYLLKSLTKSFAFVFLMLEVAKQVAQFLDHFQHWTLSNLVAYLKNVEIKENIITKLQKLYRLPEALGQAINCSCYFLKTSLHGRFIAHMQNIH